MPWPGPTLEFSHVIEALQRIATAILHLDNNSMNSLAEYLGPWLYLLVALIVFAETGLVVTPFLPGDSLLFALGALAAHPASPINPHLCVALLIVMAVLGDAVNYAIGYHIGPRVFASEKSWLLNKKHLNEAQRFYDKYGGKTIFLARFVPIVRTFAPFVAGIGKMAYTRFAAYNVVGAIVWVALFLYGGYFFGGLPVVQRNFKLVILAIIVISILPAVWEVGRGWWSARKSATATGAEPAAATAEPVGSGE
jgi:membrane-associated protein